MPIVDFPILGGSSLDREKQMEYKRTVNMYDVLTRFGRKIGYNRRFEGIKRKITSMIGNEGRQASVFGGKLYVVISDNVYQIDTSFAVTPIGALTTNSGYVGIAANQKEPTPQIMFVDGVNGWIWTGSSFDQITDPNFPGQPLDVDYTANRFLVASGAAPFIGVSDINDGFTWQVSNRLALRTDSDTKCVGVKVLNGSIVALGSKLLTLFNDVGGASPPFEPDVNFSPNLGAVSAGSAALNGNIDRNGNPSLFFLGQTKDGSFPVMKMVGTTPYKVSATWVDDMIANFKNPFDVRTYVYSEGGKTFYQMSFTEDNKTLVYDDTNSTLENPIWYEREMLDGSRYIGQCHAYFNGVHCLLSYKDGILYDMHKDYVDNDGEPIRRLTRSSPLIDESYKEIELVELILDVAKGIGTLTPPDDNPTVRVKISTDGGVTFGNTIELSLAPMGDYTYFTMCEQLAGVYNTRAIVLEIECTSRVNYNLFGASLQYNVMER